MRSIDGDQGGSIREHLPNGQCEMCLGNCSRRVSVLVHVGICKHGACSWRCTGGNMYGSVRVRGWPGRGSRGHGQANRNSICDAPINLQKPDMDLFRFIFLFVLRHSSSFLFRRPDMDLFQNIIRSFSNFNHLFFQKISKCFIIFVIIFIPGRIYGCTSCVGVGGGYGKKSLNFEDRTVPWVCAHHG